MNENLIEKKIGEYQLFKRIYKKIYEATDESLTDSVDAQIKITMERTERLITSLYNRLKGGKQE